VGGGVAYGCSARYDLIAPAITLLADFARFRGLRYENPLR
jgi:hypothetical protein